MKVIPRTRHDGELGRNRIMRKIVLIEPKTCALRHDPRFQDLLRRMKLGP